MSDICESSKCTACMACLNICPKNCIKLRTTNYGFLSPYITEYLCIRM